jgi:hypothetical protein
LENTGSTGFKTGSTGFGTVHLFGKYRFNRFLHCSPFWKILVQPDTQPVFVWWKQVQPVLKQVQPVFALFTFFCQSAGSTGFGTGSTGFLAEKSKTASFGAPPIYTHSYLSLHSRARLGLHS